jgi:CRISPR system Cascade subunit CasC
MALFGRMVAKPTELSVDAACQVAHAISTHSAKTEYDYYVAVDDLCDNGAAFLDAAEFNSSTLYRYAVVDVQQLSKTLAEEDDDEIAGVVSSFINSFIRSMPTGKQNSYANRTLPSMVYVTVRTDAPVSLVDAFEKPVYSTDGYMEASESRFVDFAKKKFAQFGIAPAQAYGVGDAVAAMGVDPQTVPDMLNSVKESVKNYLTEEG